jgi:membrane-associated protease RseP (regulator of RpoE activity)
MFMKRITAKFLGAVWVLGSGASAMADPSHDPSGGQDSQNQPGSCAQDQGDDDAQSQAPPHNGAQAPAPGQPQGPAPAPGQAQGPAQPGAQDQDQDQDTAETFAWSTGPSHLGVLVMGMTPELRQHFGAPVDRGVLIAKIEPSSPAARAGLQIGDVIVRVGPRYVRNGDDVIQALGAQPGGRVRIVVVRQGHAVRIDAMLPGRPQPPQPNQQNQL